MVRFFLSLLPGLLLFSTGFCQVLDKNFAINGVAILSEFNSNLYPRDITADGLNNSYILCENLNFHQPTEADSILHIVKITPDGNVDKGFGDMGIVTLVFDYEVWASAIFIANSNLFITGRKANPGSSTSISFITDFIVATTLDGQIDLEFGNQGVLSEESLISLVGEATKTSTLINNNIYITSVNNDTVIVCSLNNLGIINNNFGNDGYLTVTFEKPIRSTLIRANYNSNELYLFTSIDTQQGFNKFIFGCTKLSLNGIIDSTFGVNGSMYTPAIEGGFVNPPRLVWSDINAQNIFQTYSTFSNQETRYFRSKISISGVLDTALGENGLLEIPETQSGFFLSQTKNIYKPSTQNSNQAIAAYTDSIQALDSFGVTGVFEINTSQETERCSELLYLNDSTMLALGWIYEQEIFIPTVSKVILAGLTSIDFHDSHLGKSVFPNPAQNTLYIPEEIPSQKEFRLFNSQGQVFNTPPLNEDRLDISQLAPGIYFLQVGEHIWRFVKE